MKRKKITFEEHFLKLLRWQACKNCFKYAKKKRKKKRN